MNDPRKGKHFSPDTEFKKGEHRSPQTEFKKGFTRHSKKLYWDKEWLEDQYINQCKSALQIAKEQGCNENNILYFLQKLQICTRSMTEIRKMKYWGLFGEKNPMYGRIGCLAPQWKGGTTQDRQLLYSESKWKTLVKTIWKRDYYHCQLCGKGYDGSMMFHIHHIIGFEVKEKRLDPNNLVLLCIECHIFVHSKKNIEMKYLNPAYVEIADAKTEVLRSQKRLD